MGYTEIDVSGAVTLTVLRRDAGEIPVDRGLLNTPAWGWGIDGSGRPYFDTDGASPGEHALLGADQNGTVFLEDAASAPVYSLHRASAPARSSRRPLLILAPPRCRR